MKKADNFDAGKWLVENKITFQSRLNENQINNKYVVKDDELSDEDGDFYSIDTDKALDYLKQFNNEDVDAEAFIDDDEGWGEFEQYLDDVEQMSDEELEDEMRTEMSMYFFSDPDTLNESRLNEANEDLLDFIKANSKEIAQAVGATNLKNITSDSMGDISATPLFTDYEMVTASSAPKSTITLNGETFSIQDIISNPSMFLNKKVVFQRSDDYNPEKRTIGTIEGDRIGFNERSKSMGSDISFSENPITDGDTSGDIEVGGKTIYYTMYNV